MCVCVGIEGWYKRQCSLDPVTCIRYMNIKCSTSVMNTDCGNELHIYQIYGRFIISSIGKGANWRVVETVTCTVYISKVCKRG